MDVDGKDQTKAKSFDDVRRKVKQIVREGYSASQLLSQVCFLVRDSFQLNPYPLLYSCTISS